MTPIYYVPLRLSNQEQQRTIQQHLQPYPIFTDRSGNLQGTAFSKQPLPPYEGELFVIKTLKKEAAKTAQRVLTGLEGITILPIMESTVEEDDRYVAELRKKKASQLA